MCVPSMYGSFASGVLGVTKEIMGYNSSAKNIEYQTQAAINNANLAKNEALRVSQQGIDEARKEKIQGMQEANKQLARNAASGLDATSQTSMYSYQDTIDSANSSADLLKNNYDWQASSYFERANRYLNQARDYQNSYNGLLFNTAMNALGTTKKVAENWYK